MVITVLVYKPDGTKVIEEREVPDDLGEPETEPLDVAAYMFGFMEGMLS